MRYWYQPPHALLADYVRTVLVADMLTDSGDNRVPLVVAGMPAVVAELPKGVSAGASIALTLFGSPVPPEFSLDETHAIVIAYCFKPFVLASLFDIQAQKVAKGALDFDIWNKRKSAHLKNRLSVSQNPADLIDAMDDFFINLLDEQRHACEVIRIATDKMMLDSGAESLNRLPDALNITKRTFQRMFKKYVGISPTEYRRICQFQQSFHQVRSRQFEKLSDVAADNGFADQSHFVRSFREFSQTTPGKYLDEGLHK